MNKKIKWLLFGAGKAKDFRDLSDMKLGEVKILVEKTKPEELKKMNVDTILEQEGIRRLE